MHPLPPAPAACCLLQGCCTLCITPQLAYRGALAHRPAVNACGTAHPALSQFRGGRHRKGPLVCCSPTSQHCNHLLIHLASFATGAHGHLALTNLCFDTAPSLTPNSCEHLSWRPPRLNIIPCNPPPALLLTQLSTLALPPRPCPHQCPLRWPWLGGARARRSSLRTCCSTWSARGGWI